jgi:hypothetical protein
VHVGERDDHQRVGRHVERDVEIPTEGAVPATETGDDPIEAVGDAAHEPQDQADLRVARPNRRRTGRGDREARPADRRGRDAARDQELAQGRDEPRERRAEGIIEHMCTRRVGM